MTSLNDEFESVDDYARMGEAKKAALMLSFFGGAVKLAGTGRDVYVDTKTQKALDTVQAFDYMAGNARMEFDDLSPAAQKLVKQEFADRPQELQTFIQQQSPTGTISKEAQSAVDDMLSPLNKNAKTTLNGVDTKISGTLPVGSVIAPDFTGAVAVEAEMKPRVRNVADVIQKKTGIKIGFAEYYQNGQKNNAYKGHYDPTTKTMYFRKGASNAEIIYKTGMHELTHAIEDTKHYAYVSDYVLNKKFGGVESDKYKKAIAAKIAAYKKNGEILDESGARRELVAENLRKAVFATNEDVRRIVEQDYTFAQHVHDWIGNMLYWVKNTFGHMDEKAQLQADLEQAQRKYRLALANAKGMRGGGNAEFEIVTLPDGKKYVQASKDKANSDDLETAAKEVQARIDDEVRHGHDVRIIADDGDVLTITIDTSWKAGSRDLVTRTGGIKTPMTDDEFRTKLNAELHIDEIASVSKRNSQTVPDKKNHAFAKDGFHYRTAYYRDYDGRYYRLGVSVGENGEVKTVYNIGYTKKLHSLIWLKGRAVKPPRKMEFLMKIILLLLQKVKKIFLRKLILHVHFASHKRKRISFLSHPQNPTTHLQGWKILT